MLPVDIIECGRLLNGFKKIRDSDFEEVRIDVR
jgi:hypothetical protein